MRREASIERLRAWLAKRGFSLEFGSKSNEVCFTAKRVTLQRQLKAKAKVATLLHECGHILVYLNRLKCKHARVAGASWSEWCRLRSYKSKHSKLLVLHEEMVAWERGYRLAQRMKLRLPAALKANVQTRALMSYVRYAALS